MKIIFNALIRQIKYFLKKNNELSHELQRYKVKEYKLREYIENEYYQEIEEGEKIYFRDYFLTKGLLQILDDKEKE